MTLASSKRNPGGLQFSPRSKRFALALGAVAVSAPLVAGSADASVFGTDSRQTVNATTSPTYANEPLKWIASVSATNVGFPYCSAFFYDNNTVATAGHCVYNDFDLNGTREYITAANSVYVSRAAYWNGTGSIKPYGTCGGVGVSTTSDFLASLSRTADYAAIRLDASCTLPTSWFPLSSLVPAIPGTTYVSGYPGDLGATSGKPYNLVKGSGSILGALYSPPVLCYDIDTNAGESGSPVYQLSASGATAYGIHTQGVAPGGAAYMPGCQNNQNGGIWLGQSAQTNLYAWRA